MHQNVCALGKVPSIATLALYETDFVSVEAAVAWIYEEEEGESTLRHPFIASLPATEEFTTSYLPYLDEE